jgi:hypothetical protein
VIDKARKKQQERDDQAAAQGGQAAAGDDQAVAGDGQAAAKMTRRDFMTGVLGTGVACVAAAAGSAATLSGCRAQKAQQFEDLVLKGVQDQDIVTLKVAPEQVIEATDFEEVPSENYLGLQASYELPLGSLVYQIDSSSALVLLPGEEGESLRKIGILGLADGEVSPVISRPVTTGKNVVIYDARASKTTLIWVELDLGTRHWSVHVAALSGAAAENTRMLEEGDGDYEPPLLAASDEKLYWTVMPVATGAASKNDSLLRALNLRQEQALEQGVPYTVLASHGRMITNPLITEGIVTFVPRVDTSNVYYQLTALSCTDDKPVAFKVLPQSLKVADALYLGGAFFFSIENNYDYAGGLSHFGSYQELDQGNYLRVSKPPLCPAARLGDCLIIESTAAIVGVDLAARNVFAIEAPAQSASFGEALCGWGVQDRIVTTSIRLTEDNSNMEATVVRVFG